VNDAFLSEQITHTIRGLTDVFSHLSSARLRKRLARTRLTLRTPFPMLLDKVGLMRRPYTVSWHNGVRVELRPGVHGERYVFYEVFMKSAYFSLGQHLRPGDTVIDVGANVGFFSIQAASLVGPAGSVIALEPQPDTFAQLQRNIAVSGMRNIRARQVAVTDQKGAGRLFFGDTPIYSSLFPSVDDQPRDARSQEVITTTLADIMRDEGVDRCHYLKLDCEGGEYAICRSLSPELARSIDQITMEVHQIPGQDPSDLKRSLTGAGFRFRAQDKLFSFDRRLL
jgi:FkbM family methyltransferase